MHTYYPHQSKLAFAAELNGYLRSGGAFAFLFSMPAAWYAWHTLHSAATNKNLAMLDRNIKHHHHHKHDKKDKKDKKRDGSSDSEKREKRKKRTEGLGLKPPDKRTRNLFAGMLGHLNKAKSRLDVEKGSKAHELRMKAEQRSDERLSKAASDVKELRKRQFEEQKKEEETKMVSIEKQIAEKELLLLQRRLESHYSLMMNFIRTQAEPTIFYLPAKHNKETEAKLEETRGAIKHKIASLKVQLQPLPAGDEADPEVAKRASAGAAALAAALGEPGKALPEAADGSDDEASIPDTNKEKKDKKDDDDEESKEAGAKKDGDDDEDKSGDEDDKKRKNGKDDASESKENSKKRKTGDDDKDGGSGSESGKSD